MWEKKIKYEKVQKMKFDFKKMQEMKFEFQKVFKTNFEFQFSNLNEKCKNIFKFEKVWRWNLNLKKFGK